VVSELNSQLECRGFESHQILDGNGVKAMSKDRFLHPTLVHSIIEKKENSGSQLGQTKIILLNIVKVTLTLVDGDIKLGDIGKGT